MTSERATVPVVFISSTVEDLALYRAAAKEAAIEEELLLKMMEYFEARSDNPPLDVCLTKVDEADVVVVVVAHRYGWVPPDQLKGEHKSITWLEIERAVGAGKEVLAFLVDEHHAWPVEQREEYRAMAALLAGNSVTPELDADIRRNAERLRDFKAWLSGRGIRMTFTNPDDLKGKVAYTLRAWRDRQHTFARVAQPVQAPRAANPEKYLRWLLARTAFIDIRGLQVGSGKAHRFPIDDLFVTLTTLPPAAHTEDGEQKKPRRKTKATADEAALPARAVPLHEALRRPRLVVLGDPGSGKTTFLNRVASALCKTRLGDDRAAATRLGFTDAPFPLYVRIADLAEHMETSRAIGVERHPIAEGAAWLAHFLEKNSADNQCPLPAGFFAETLERGSSLLLIDGLDEAPDRVVRESIARLVENAARAFVKSAIVVTTRPGAYVDEAVLPAFAHARIELLDDEGIETFLDRWCAALYPESRADADRHRAGLTDALKKRPEIRRMVRTPVMLTALAVVHWNEHRLPEQRADLYDSVITWLARSREQRPERPTAERAVALLSELALKMQSHAEGRRVQIARREAAEAIAGEWREEPQPHRRIALAERFLDAEELDSGIIVRRGPDVRFWHLTFQEFLAARAIAGRPDDEQRRILREDNRLYRPEWREVVLLLGGLLHKQGRAKADALVHAVLESLAHEASLAEKARAVGLVGSIARDLTPLGYEPADVNYGKLLDEVLAIFDPVAAARVTIETRIEAAEALGRAGDPRLDPGREDHWVTVPVKKFFMGAQSKDRKAPHFDPEAHDDESPVHEVHLNEYRIGRYPVTVVEYERFIEDGGYDEQRWWSAGGFDKWSEPERWGEQRDFPNRPVTGASWFEAAAYAAWAGGRLPTEAEWERAARGTDGRTFPWGNDAANPQRLNFGESNIGHPTPVGIYPSGAGLGGVHDMAGNVFEWCEDLFGSYAGTPSKNPRGPGKGGGRVVRGGSWGSYSGGARSAFRLGYLPDLRDLNIGFRVVVAGGARTR